jgi:Flp pilus assembly protein TadG
VANRPRRVSGDSGMSTSQVAILFPAVLVWLLLIVQYGLWWHAKQVADAATAEAVTAAVTPTGTDDIGHDAAQRFLDQAGNLRDVTITVERGPATVTATVTGHAPRLIPGLAWSVTARSIAPVEEYLDLNQR